MPPAFPWSTLPSEGHYPHQQGALLIWGCEQAPGCLSKTIKTDQISCCSNCAHYGWNCGWKFLERKAKDLNMSLFPPKAYTHTHTKILCLSVVNWYTHDQHGQHIIYYVRPPEKELRGVHCHQIHIKYQNQSHQQLRGHRCLITDSLPTAVICPFTISEPWTLYCLLRNCFECMLNHRTLLNLVFFPPPAHVLHWSIQRKCGSSTCNCCHEPLITFTDSGFGHSSCQNSKIVACMSKQSFLLLLGLVSMIFKASKQTKYPSFS